MAPGEGLPREGLQRNGVLHERLEQGRRSSRDSGAARSILRRGFWLAPALLVLWWLGLALIPDPFLKQFTARPYSLTITDRTGVPLQTLPVEGGLMREFSRLDDLPPLVRRVFLLSEDEQFYGHIGVDVVGLVRAVIQNSRAGRIVSGGSTISMQLARLIRPHQGGLQGKVREAFYAVRLEAELSKPEILELWMNSIPFGFATEGVQSAAHTFFGMTPAELTTEQVLLLAVIPRRPEQYDPRSQPEAAAAAALQLADRVGVPVTETRLLAAAREADGPAARAREAPHFVRFVSGELDPERWASGAPVRTTLDLEIQHALEAAIRGRVINAERFRIGTGAGIVLDNTTGAILAYVGSADFDDKATSGQIDGVRIRRQPGSTLKPFLYALALEHGFTAATILPDIPTEFGGAEIYVPENFNRRFNGPVRMRTALASSLNVPAVYMIERLGVAAFAGYLEELGFESLAEQRRNVGAGLALGNAEVTLAELARAFTVFARDGSLPSVHWQSTSDYAEVTVMSAPAAGIIRSILADEPARVPGFGIRSVLDTSFGAIFKTGTSSQFNNIWALGSSASLTVGVWMGNFGGETVIGTPGSSLPAAVAKEVLALFTPAGSRLPPPHGVREVPICATSGMAATPNCPAVLGELFIPGSEPDPCTWHVAPGQPVRYPPEYQSWALDRRYPAATLVRSGNGSHKLSIVRPADGAVYYIDPTVALRDQAIPVEVVADESPIQLYVEGAFVSEGNSPLLVLLPLRRGTAEILAVAGDAAERRIITVK